MPAAGNPAASPQGDLPAGTKWSLKIAGAVLFVLYCSALLLEPTKDDSTTAKFQAGAAAERDISREPTTSGVIKGLVANAWIDTNRVERGDSLKLSVTFENHTSGAIHDLRFVQFNAPGFVVPGCWYANTCMQGGESSAAVQSLPRTLAAGGSATVRAELKPSTQSGRYNLLAVFAWSQDKEEFRRAVSIGPIEVTTWWRDTILFAGKPLKELIQGLALPAVLILLGWYFQRRDKEREELRKASETEQEERQRIWNNLLPGLLENAQKHYMPANRSIKNLLLAAKRAREKMDTATQHEYTYWLLVCCRRFRALRENLGGFHFKDRNGEKVAALSWVIVNHHIDQRFALRDKDQILDLLSPSESFATFEERFRHWQSKEIVARLDGQAVNWLQGDPQGTFAEVQPVLEILSMAIDYEINRPFRYWYTDQEKFDRPRCEAAKKRLPAAPAQFVAQLHDALTEYLAKLEA